MTSHSILPRNRTSAFWTITGADIGAGVIGRTSIRGAGGPYWALSGISYRRARASLIKTQRPPGQSLARRNLHQCALSARRIIMNSKSWRLPFIALFLLMLAPALSHAQISVSVNIAPPELPVYDQPPIPGDGYIWTPGYWAWGDDIQDYYWVPGTWIEPPQPDYLWTPGYWAADGAAFIWHAGYWGPQVGFYGGVNYGFGYGGRGYEGGYWRDGHIFYNRAVVNVGSAHITNVYNKTVVNNINVTRVSFNGGSGGVRAQASSAEL